MKIEEIRKRLQHGMTLTREAVSKGLTRHTILLPQHLEALEAICHHIQHSQRKQAFQSVRVEILSILKHLESYHDDHKIVILDALTNLLRFPPNVKELEDSECPHTYIDVLVSLLKYSTSDGVVWATCNVLEYMLINHAENARLLRRRRGVRAIVDLFVRSAAASAEDSDEDDDGDGDEEPGEQEEEEDPPLQDPSLGCLTAATRVLKRFVQCQSDSTYFNKCFLVLKLEAIRHVSTLLKMVMTTTASQNGKRQGRSRSNAVVHPVRPGGSTIHRSAAAKKSKNNNNNKKKGKAKNRKNQLPLSANEQERLCEEAIVACIDFLGSLVYPFEDEIRSQTQPLEPIVAFVYKHLEHLNAKTMEKVLSVLASLSKDPSRVADLERTMLFSTFQRGKSNNGKKATTYENPLHALMLFYSSKDKLSEQTLQTVGCLLANVCHRKSEHALDLLCRPNIGRIFISECFNYIQNSSYNAVIRAHSTKILANMLSKDASLVDSKMRQNIIRTILSILALTTPSDNPEVSGLIKETKLDAMRAFVILRPAEKEFVNMDIWNEYFLAIEKHISDYVVCTWLLQFSSGTTLSHLDRTDDLVLETIVHVLRNLIIHEKANERVLFEFGITLSLVRLLQEKPMLRSAVLFIVKNFALSNVDFCVKFVRLGGLESLRPLMIPSLDEAIDSHGRTSVTAIKIMAHLIKKGHHRQLQLAETGALSILHDLLISGKYDKDNKLQCAAVLLLRHLSDHEIVARWIGRMGFIPKIVNLVKNSTSAKLIEQLTMTLLNLSYIISRRNKKQIVTASDFFARLLDSPNPNIQENVAILISNLATVPSLRKKMRADTSLLFALQRLIENEDINLSQTGETALNCFNVSDEVRPPASISMRQEPRRSTSSPLLMKRFDSFRGFSLTDFENRKKLIDVQYKTKLEHAVQEMLELPPNSIKVSIDWNFFDTVLKERDEMGRKRSRALHLVQKKTWINLKECLGQFADQSDAHTYTLQKNVVAVMVSIAASGHVDFDNKQRKIVFQLGYDDLNPMSNDEVVQRLNSAMWSEIEQSELIKGKNKPVSRERLISTTRNVEELKKNDTMQWMKVLANSSHQGVIFLGHLLELLENDKSGKFYRMTNAKDLKLVDMMRQKLEGKGERLLRAWKVVTVDKKNIKQDRLLLLSNTTLHSVRYDAITGKHNTLHDDRHYRQYSLSDYHLIDVGHYKESNKPVMVIYTKARSQVSVPPILRLPSLLTSDDTLPTGAQRKRDSSSSASSSNSSASTSSNRFGSGARQGSRAMLNRHDRTDTISHVPFGQLVQATTNEESDDEKDTNASTDKTGNMDARPAMDDVNSLVIIPPHDTMKSAQRDTFLTEIAWTVFAVSCTAVGYQVRRPYENQEVEKPKKTVASSLYNRFKGKK